MWCKKNEQPEEGKEGVIRMFVPKWYFEAQYKKINDLERRVKRIELIFMEESKRRIASLSDKEAGSINSDGILTIEEILNKTTDI